MQDAAGQAKVSERTIYRWLADPTFAGRMESARAELVSRTSGMLTSFGLAACVTLYKLMMDDISTPASLRLSAARTILELGARLREVASLEERLARLEASVEDPAGARR